MSIKVKTFSINQLLHSVLRWGSIILVVIAIVLLSLLSFVDKLGLNPNVRNLTTIALIGVILNYSIWDTFYKDQYTKVMSDDINQIAVKRYSIHKRYYDARKGLTQDILREYIHQYNKAFTAAWLQDVEDITGRKIEDIRIGRYKGNSHKILIWRIKHRAYPKSGVNSPRQLLNMLSVGRSEGMKLTTNAETIYHNSNRIGKLFTSICTMFFAASIVYEFITEGWSHAVIQLVIYIATIFMSLFFGAMSGLKGAQIKLSTVEEVCSLLEDWRNQPPQIDKYDEAKDDTVKDEIVKPVEVEPQKSVDNRVIEIE